MTIRIANTVALIAALGVAGLPLSAAQAAPRSTVVSSNGYSQTGACASAIRNANTTWYNNDTERRSIGGCQCENLGRTEVGNIQYRCAVRVDINDK